MEAIEGTRTRRSFLRQLGITLAAGIGAVALPHAAKAVSYTCCYDYDNCHNAFPNCAFPSTCVCPAGSYCACYTHNPNCGPAPC